MIDFVIRNARLPEGGEPVDIGFEGGRIAAVERGLACDAPEHDAAGCLCCGGLVETHIHLDKSRIIDRCAPEPGNRQAKAMERVSDVKHTFTVEDVYARAAATIERCIANGATRMRTHAEVDPKVGLRGFEGVLQVARDYAWAIDVEICVMPQEGLTNNPGTDELMVEAMRRGARVVGAAPNYDSDSSAQVRRVFEIAREFDADIDMHLDSGASAEHLDAKLVCELTQEYGWGGRVAFGHGTKLSTLPPDEQRAWARRLADAGVAVTVLPATDLFLMGRDQTHNVRRGLVDANLFTEQGCNCSLSTNNILNPFTPFGDCSLIRLANLHANTLQVAEAERIGACFGMITERSARLMNLKDYGVAVGNPADVVVIDAQSPRQAVAEIAQPLAVFKRGRRTVTRTRPELHRPA
jgi:cytosine/creatinine deaminase